jgi:hypothetical protein
VQRHTVVAEIFGYLVCLLAVAIFFASVAGIVNNAFRVVHPTERAHVMARIGPTGLGMMGPGMMGPGSMHRHATNTFFWRARAPGGGPGIQMYGQAGPMAGGSNAVPKGIPSPPPGMDITTMHARAIGDARYDATRRLVLAIVMLIVSILVFRRTFAWLSNQ